MRLSLKEERLKYYAFAKVLPFRNMFFDLVKSFIFLSLKHYDNTLPEKNDNLLFFAVVEILVLLFFLINSLLLMLTHDTRYQESAGICLTLTLLLNFAKIHFQPIAVLYLFPNSCTVFILQSMQFWW